MFSHVFDYRTSSVISSARRAIDRSTGKLSPAEPGDRGELTLDDIAELLGDEVPDLAGAMCRHAGLAGAAIGGELEKIGRDDDDRIVPFDVAAPLRKPSAEALLDELLCDSYANVALAHRVSETTVRRWAKEYGIPTSRYEIIAQEAKLREKLAE